MFIHHQIYSWYDWLFFFYIYSFFGWIFESTYVSCKEKHFVNRGFLRLPMLPIYGSGAVMMLFAAMPMKGNFAAEYFSGAIAATLLELVTGWAMEQLFKVRYWDYSYQKFQYHGYICLSSTIAWGFLTVLMIEVIHVPVARDVLAMPMKLKSAILAMISTAFLYDSVQSTREAYALGQMLEKLQHMRQEMEEMRVQLNLLKAETKTYISERQQDAAKEAFLQMQLTKQQMKTTRAEVLEQAVRNEMMLDEKFASVKAEMDARLEEMRDAKAKLQKYQAQKEAELLQKEKAAEEKLTAAIKRRTDVLQGLSRHKLSLLRGNPDAVSERFREVLKELQEIADHHNHISK